MKITDLKPNSKNPRIISDHKLEKLKKSVREFELMMEARPIVVNSKMEILGGNMRYKALEQLGYAEIPDNWVKVMNFNRKEEKEFIIKDNIGYGDWDWDSLDGWDAEELNDWGLDLPNFANGHNINSLSEDELDLTEEFDPIGIASGVRRLIFLFDNDIEANEWVEKNHPELKIEKIGIAWRINLSTIIQ